MAEDVIQETWIRANAAATELPENPRAYVYRMAGNLAVDHLRREHGGVRSPANRADDHEDGAPVLESVPSAAPDPEATLQSQQEFRVLYQAVNELPEKCREVFLLYRGQGLSMREVASELGIAEKTVEKHIARAMVHCRGRLREAGRGV